MWSCNNCKQKCNFGPNWVTDDGEDVFLCQSCLQEAATIRRNESRERRRESYKEQEAGKNSLADWLS